MSDISKYDDSVLLDFLDANIVDELKARGFKHGWYKPQKSNLVKGSLYIIVGSRHPDCIFVGFAEDINFVLSKLNSHTFDQEFPYVIYSMPSSDDDIPSYYDDEEFFCYASYDLDSYISNDAVGDLFTCAFDCQYVHDFWLPISYEDAFHFLSLIAAIHNRMDVLHENPFDKNFFHSTDSSTVNSISNVKVDMTLLVRDEENQ